jgi:hypothetical protein
VRPTWGLVYWPIAMSAVVMIFAPAELIALFTNHVNTLSDFSRYEIGIRGTVMHPGVPAWWISLAGWLLFVVIITGHIWFLTPD